jgi:DNA processing protein
VIAACGAEPRCLEQLVALTGSDLLAMAMAVARLERSGWLRETGGWFEAVEDWADLA